MFFSMVRTGWSGQTTYYTTYREIQNTMTYFQVVIGSVITETARLSAVCGNKKRIANYGIPFHTISNPLSPIFRLTSS